MHTVHFTIATDGNGGFHSNNIRLLWPLVYQMTLHPACINAPVFHFHLDNKFRVVSTQGLYTSSYQKLENTTPNVTYSYYIAPLIIF